MTSRWRALPLVAALGLAACGDGPPVQSMRAGVGLPPPVVQAGSGWGDTVPLLLATSALAAGPDEAVRQHLIDLRSESAYAAGHIEGAVHVPAQALVQHLSTLPDPAAYHRIVLICYTGRSATRLARRLRELGFPNVAALEGGMSAWVGGG